MEFLRFLGVGLWNTAFGYASFAALTFLFSRAHPAYGYLAAALLSSALSITLAFLLYKWLVFKTRGNYWREWLRFMAVYGISTLIGLAALPVLVYLLRHLARLGASAPYAAAAALAAFNAVFNFVGNKRYTFGYRRTAARGAK